MNENEFKESLALAGLSSEQSGEIFGCSGANCTKIQAYLKHLKIDVVSFKNLEWRIDVKLATRSLKKCVEPEIVLKLTLAKGEEKTCHILQTDVTNLVNLTNKLEDALSEIKTNYCRKVLRSNRTIL